MMIDELSKKAFKHFTELYIYIYNIYYHAIYYKLHIGSDCTSE